MALSKGHGQSYAHLIANISYIVTDMADNITIVRKSCMDFQSAYLHLTLTNSKVKGRGRAILLRISCKL